MISTRRNPRILIALLLCAVALTAAKCDPYKTTASALYDISVGIDGLERFNEQAAANGIYSQAQAQAINGDVIKILTIKKQANTRFAAINPKNYTAADKSAMVALAQELAPFISDLQQQGLLGIKNPDSQKAFTAVMTTISTALAVLQGLNGGK